MKLEQKEFILKNGEKIILKSPEISDASLLLDQIIAACGATEYLTRRPEDFDHIKKDISLEEKFIESFYEGNDCLICAYCKNKIVGNCCIKFMKGDKEKHRSKVGIAIIKEYWGCGIGSLMFDELINIARNNPYCEQVELDGGVITENQRAIALYTKKGFVKTGEIPHHLKLKNNTYLDSQLMTLFLNK